MTAYLRSRAYVAAPHVANGMKLRDDLKLQEALTEFQRAVEIDSTNFVAAQEVRRTAAMLKKQTERGAALAPESPLTKLAAEAEGPVDLEPNPNNPITLRMTTTADNVYRTIGKLGGINVLFDLDYKPQRITIELNEVCRGRPWGWSHCNRKPSGGRSRQLQFSLLRKESAKSLNPT